MISVVYTIGKGSRWNDYELLFSLRSIQKHLKGIGEVFIIGECPDFLTNVNHIPAKDPYAVPDTNIMLKIKTACETMEVSEDFLFMNDDHYLMTDFEADKFPYFYCSTLEVYLKKRAGDGYGRRARNTRTSLLERGLKDKHFDIHYPILYNKKAFIEQVCDKYDMTKKDGFVLKSLYANGLKIEGIETKDFKLNVPPPKNCQVFSTHPRVSGAIYRFLEYKFPSKSMFEK